MSLKWPYLSALSRIFYPNDNSWYCIPKMVWFKKMVFSLAMGLRSEFVAEILAQNTH